MYVQALAGARKILSMHIQALEDWGILQLNFKKNTVNSRYLDFDYLE